MLTPEDLDMLRDRPVVCSVSGGKDSTALALWLREAGIKATHVSMDTEWEHPDTYAYLDGLEKEVGTIARIKPPLGMADLIRRKGMFPGRMRRFCTQLLKIKPFKQWVETHYGDSPVVVNAVGIRRSESKARANLTRWSEWMDGSRVWVWRPLIDWSEQDVIDAHHNAGIAPNPLYLRSSSRVGCWPCIYGRKAEIRAVADETPWRIDEIRALESEVQTAARDRYAARAETFETLGYMPPTFFSISAACTPIDDVVRWSKTSRGGRQAEMFGRSDGCIAWGMCDA